MASGAPTWVAWATATCVNLRFMIFSAQWRPYFIVYPRAMRLRLAYFTADLNYVMFMRRFPEPRPAPEQLPYFWGGACTNWAGLAGAVAGGHLSGRRHAGALGHRLCRHAGAAGLGLSLLSDRATGVAGLVAGCAAVAAYALPLKLNIVVAIAAAVAIGLLMDHSTPRPPAARTTAPDGLLGRRYIAIVGLAVITVVTRGFFF
jgi:predicted branched-subunit amino acid permease